MKDSFLTWSNNDAFRKTDISHYRFSERSAEK